MINASDAHNHTVICLYHNDLDGRCAAAIVRRATGPDLVLHAIDYGDPLPWDQIERAGKVIIVDFSLPLEDMQRIQGHAELIWIDHHKSALEGLSALNGVPGLRSLDEAACVLTWQWYFPDLPLPQAVVYIGDRDIWRHAHQETKPFSEGLFQQNTHPSNERLWESLFADDAGLLAQLIEHGRVLLEARLRGLERRLAHNGFEVVFEGHRTLAINQQGTGDLGEIIRRKGYAIGYCYFESMLNGRLMTSVTLYSDQVDVSAIAAKFGGGGHAGAAGFMFERGEGPFPPGANIELP